MNEIVYFKKCSFHFCSEFEGDLSANVLMFAVEYVSKAMSPKRMSRLVVRDSQNRLCFNYVNLAKTNVQCPSILAVVSTVSLRSLRAN